MFILNFLVNDNYVIALCNILTIIGLPVTILLIIRSTSLKLYLKKHRANRFYNQRRETFLSSLIKYQSSIREKSDNIYRIKDEILNDINVIYNNCKLVLKFWEKSNLRKVRRRLEKQNINAKKLCNELSKTISYLNVDKEEYYE